MTTETERRPRLLLEKLALGELDEFEKAKLDARLSREEQAEAVRRLAVENEEYLRLHPPARMAEEIRVRAGLGGQGASPLARSGGRAPGRRRPHFLLPTVGLLAAACVAAFFILHHPSLKEGTGGGDEFGQETELVKGLPPGLKAYRKTATGYAALKDGALARPGDLLQLRYQAAGARYGVLVSLDGRGEVTLHFPETPTGSTALTQGGEVSLPHSFELDDAPSFERFVFVTSDAPLSPAVVVDAARALAARSPEAARTEPLPLPGTAPASRQSDLLVRKTP